MTLYALSLDKLEPSGKAKEKEIKFTPTMIIYDKGIEIGRIIERPKNSWVTDVVMLSKLINKAK